MELTDESVSNEQRFERVRRLYGSKGLEKLKRSEIAVVGLGGVGSWAAEALARSAVGNLTMIDQDRVSLSNTNRQIQALEGNYGQYKAEVLAERIHKINPLCQVNFLSASLDSENVETLLSDKMVVLDCIDQVRSKAAIAAFCHSRGQKLFISGAAGGKSDPTQICVKDLALVEGDPLLSNLRYRLRKSYGFPTFNKKLPIKKFDLEAICSKEKVLFPKEPITQEKDTERQSNGFGSSVVVTASFGFCLASRAINYLVQY